MQSTNETLCSRYFRIQKHDYVDLDLKLGRKSKETKLKSRILKWKKNRRREEEEVVGSKEKKKKSAGYKLGFLFLNSVNCSVRENRTKPN